VETIIVMLVDVPWSVTWSEDGENRLRIETKIEETKETSFLPEKARCVKGMRMSITFKVYTRER